MWPSKTLAMLLLALWAQQSAVAADAALPEPIRTSQRAFSIPFELQPADPTSPDPREIQLQVSDDGGQTWRVAAKARTGEKQFRFLAPEEGEYWFRVTTLDARGKAWPLANSQPDMRVIVSPLRAAEAVVPGFPVERMPPTERARMVNSLSFELDYDVQAVGPADVGRIELWWTGDGGLQWRKFGVDDDQQSPVLISVDREGLYGFWMVIENKQGVRSEPPQAGSLPQIWVGVDTTRPRLRVLSTELQTVPEGQELTVRWEARDALLSPRPVALAYSASRQGPWLRLESELENRGVYRCVLPRRVPAQIYLHVEVRDEAGNVEEVDSREPVVLTARQPAGTTR